MLRGKPSHPVLGQNPYPLIRLYSGKKGYDKIHILFYKNSRFSKVLPMFSKKAKDLKIRLESQGLISYLIILIFSFFRLYLCAQKQGLKPYRNIIISKICRFVNIFLF